MLCDEFLPGNSLQRREDPPLKRSTRTKGPPNWIKDFICPQLQQPTPTVQSSCKPIISPNQPASSQSVSLTANKTSYSLFQPTDLAHLSQSYVASLAKVLQTQEPHCYEHAKQYPEWAKAMQN